MKSINKCIFKQCISLTKITIPTRIEEIQEYAFYGRDSLFQVVIPPTISYADIKERSFPAHTTILQFFL